MLFYDTQTLQIFILGDGGFARELLVYFDKHTNFEPQLVPQNRIKEYQVKAENSWTILGSGHPDIKRKMAAEAVGQFATFIHPKSTMHAARVGRGSIVAPGAVLAPNSVIQEHVLVNYNATIGHDTTIDNFSVICPNAAVGGTCTLGKGVYVGAGASIKEGLTIADNVIIGMGAAVVKDILEPGITVVGVPARKLEK